MFGGDDDGSSGMFSWVYVCRWFDEGEEDEEKSQGFFLVLFGFGKKKQFFFYCSLILCFNSQI